MQTISKDSSLEELLQSIKPGPSNVPQRITISRSEILSDSIGFFKKRIFDFQSPIRVTFEGEPAVDSGGPKREYFTLLLHALLSPSSPVRLFEGRNNFLLPMHNVDAIRAGLFKVVGRMTTSSILNGGPGFHTLVQYCLNTLPLQPQKLILLLLKSPKMM